eukprot:jgi/Hompol1/4755/HPOL_001240-RA
MKLVVFLVFARQAGCFRWNIVSSSQLTDRANVNYIFEQAYLASQDPTLERSFRGHKDVVTSLAFKPSMTQLASASMDHSVMIWNFKPQLRAFRFVGHKAPVTCIDFSPSGNLLASCSRDKTVRLWTPNVKGDVIVFKAHTSTVRAVHFSGDGEQLLTASDDKTIKLWSAHRTRFQYTLAGHLNWVRMAKFSPDSRVIVSGSDDKTVRLWDLASKSCIKTYWDHTGMVSSVAFHPSGTVVASASTDRSIKLFDIRMHKLIQHYSEAHAAPAPGLDSSLLNASGGVSSVAFGGLNGEWLISTGMDGVVKIWDVKEGHLFYTLHGHKHGATTAAVFSPTGSYFATAGSDSQVMVWKSNFDEVGRLDFELPPNTNDASASSAYPHTRHALHTDPVNFQSASSRHGSKTPPIAAPVSITNGPNGLTFQKQNTGVISDTPRFFGGASLSGTQTALQSPPEIVEITSTVHNETEAESYLAGLPVESNSAERPQTASLRTEQQRATSLDTRSSSDQVSATLQHLVRQIDVLTQTMSILESRLTMNEDRLGELAQLFQGMRSGPALPQSPQRPTTE